LTDTREKLNEARFFLSRMKDTESDREAFKYNLSAFMSAARSVRWFMWGEYKDVPDFKSWWNKKKEWIGVKRQEGDSPADIKAKLFAISDPIQAANAFLEDARNLTIHERNVKPRSHITVNITEPLSLRASLRGVVVRADGTEGGTFSEGPAQSPELSEGDVRVEWRWYFEDLPPAVDALQQDVVTLSEEYLSRLEDFVAECEAKFPV
jgi:hypothetical protein